MYPRLNDGVSIVVRLEEDNNQSGAVLYDRFLFFGIALGVLLVNGSGVGRRRCALDSGNEVVVNHDSSLMGKAVVSIGH